MTMRVQKQFTDAKITVTQNGKTIAEKKIKKAIPATMIELNIPGSRIEDDGNLEVSVL